MIWNYFIHLGIENFTNQYGSKTKNQTIVDDKNKAGCCKCKSFIILLFIWIIVETIYWGLTQVFFFIFCVCVCLFVCLCFFIILFLLFYLIILILLFIIIDYSYYFIYYYYYSYVFILLFIINLYFIIKILKIYYNFINYFIIY